MQELSGSDSPIPTESTDPDNRAEKKHRYWKRFREKVKRTEKGKFDELQSAQNSVDIPDRTNDSIQGTKPSPVDRRRVKSLRVPHQLQASKSSAPRSLKFLGLTGITPRKGFFRRAQLGDRKAHEPEEEDEVDPLRLETSLPTSSDVNQKSPGDLSAIGKRRVSLRAVRHTKGNETMLFGKDLSMCSPLSNLTSNGTKTRSYDKETSQDSQIADNVSLLGSRARSLLDLRSTRQENERGLSSKSLSLLLSSGLAENSKVEIGSGDDDYETVSSHSEKSSECSQSESNSGFGTLPNLRLLFKDVISQDRSTKTGHYPSGSAGVRSFQRHVLGKGRLDSNSNNKNALIRRSSSLPDSLHKDLSHGSSLNPPIAVLTSEDAMQSPWGVKADQSEASSGRSGSITLVLRMADMSSAVQGLTGRRGKDSDSGSIHSSDEDDVRCEDGAEGRARGPVEMFQDDFVEYTMKKARNDGSNSNGWSLLRPR